jgi:hypothetical protein
MPDRDAHQHAPFPTATPSDMRCMHTGKSNLEVGPNGKHFEDQLVLLDQTGRTIGPIGVVFNYKLGMTSRRW